MLNSREQAKEPVAGLLRETALGHVPGVMTAPWWGVSRMYSVSLNIEINLMQGLIYFGTSKKIAI
jgi:hypothetical protein